MVNNSDLISRKALLEQINGFIFDTANPDVRRGELHARSHICELIKNQPSVCMPINYDLDCSWCWNRKICKPYATLKGKTKRFRCDDFVPDPLLPNNETGKMAPDLTDGCIDRNISEELQNRLIREYCCSVHDGYEYVGVPIKA